MSIMFVEYQTREELEHAHPEIKNFTLVYQIPHAQTLEEMLAALREKKVQGRCYRVGNFVWKPTETLPKVMRPGLIMSRSQ